jgi:hypothetical protein
MIFLNNVIPSEVEGSHEISPLRVAKGNAPVEMTESGKPCA